MTKAIRKSADESAEKLTAAEGKVLQLKSTGRGQDEVRYPPMLAQKIRYLVSQAANSADVPPTKQQNEVAQQFKQQGEESHKEMQQLLDKDVAAFNAMLCEKNIANILVKATSGGPARLNAAAGYDCRSRRSNVKSSK